MEKVNPATNKFETDLKKIDEIVAQLERDELSLDKSLSQFEKGVELIRGCQKRLKVAEQKMAELLSKSPEEKL